MTEHDLSYPYASSANTQPPIVKVAAPLFDLLVILDPVGVRWDTICDDDIARDPVRKLDDAGILKVATSAGVLAKDKRPICGCRTPRDDDRDYLCRCHAQSHANRK